MAYAERLAADPAARPGLRDVADALAAVSAQLAATLDPQMVVLGGAFVPLGEVLRPAVEDGAGRGLHRAGRTGGAEHARPARSVGRRSGGRPRGRLLRAPVTQSAEQPAHPGRVEVSRAWPACG